MTRYEKAVENHRKGYNCAQAVACAFAEDIGCGEDILFRLAEGFGGGTGGTGATCGAVSGMVFVAGAVKSRGVDALPETNKKSSYAFARELMEAFKERVGTTLCCDIKGKNLLSCDGCIELGVKILEAKLGV